ncbi:hypothetical protein COW81_02095 [Candidatus Campbellbacteria bacterium CG22_combo_CG10-13_8_21_14_all_36_13]|uniref:Uncharacterized protein n=1 Tax=Candidatus Campbellbacteria bacterium CG22_combo_CG10-13_8_21_14_all_36_13 TaxID=1974529 RepID=A0A2H0DZV1_9BACT|nr:MAG: hypothetical protein COW81_02095 [Candidatus Campbellbacteria bacterium CG22_combo_CG10-13_8_21_14_all_36_13]
MSDVEFENQIRYNIPTQEESGITGWIIKKGISSTKSGANKILLGVFVFLIIFALFVIFSSGGNKADDPYKYIENIDQSIYEVRRR